MIVVTMMIIIILLVVSRLFSIYIYLFLLMSFFVKDLSSIRNCITNSSGENKLLQCVLFFDEYRKLRCSEISSSNTTFMSRTIMPMVICFRNHNHSNPHLFLNRFDIDTSIYNFGKKKCQGKVNTNCLLN